MTPSVLDGLGKAELFVRIAERLACAGLFVMGDVPDRPLRRPRRLIRPSTSPARSTTSCSG
jgi:hypothetical protein